ncbi:LacI family DNA-binding transcriptional regulator [Arthrobacter sp. EH-1B-1]|uniref:LacI family DNA-binding transcriptional regulator n=1 Tax=Arthrobacter vasquezii TaxID=2977629 RepID=A0ABT6CU73_9MICC|nr:LacI family DNA-binding transcriptional regulator [Arthrobacter vasquezii]MDF9277616.1 LacI family DNA-binding transcriptional regulator [Arthrobacter vasquezii]
MPKRPTLADVAALAKVDRTVVSKVVSEDPNLRVRDETRERVKRAVKELGYRPNSLARSLRISRTGTLGVILPSFSNPIWATMLEGAEAEAQRRGYVLLAGTVDRTTNASSRFLELARTGAVDGVLVAAALTDEDLPTMYSQLPWLLVNRRTVSSHRHVLLDDERAALIATDHLLQLGHTRIAHLSGPLEVDSAQRRKRGFLRALQAYDLEPGPIVDASNTFEGGQRALTQVLTEDPTITALAVGNVAAATGVLAAAAQRGIRIPDDLSVIAIHDIDIAAALNPPLTTVRMPLAELGAQAISLLLDRPADEAIEEVISGPLELVKRFSTAPPRRNS